MNVFFHMLLSYIYTGVALCGLCAGKANELTNGLYNDEPEDEATEALRTKARDRVVICAQQIGIQMAGAAPNTLGGQLNANIIGAYEAAKTHNEQRAGLHVVKEQDD